jgi:GNAT superfamily N-acetyltransferase
MLSLVDRLSNVMQAESVRWTQIGAPARPDAACPPGPEYRTAAPADCEAIRSFVAGLSPRTRFLRFFTPASPSSAVLRAMCGAGGADVLVASLGGAVIAHAMAVDSAGPGGCRAAGIGLVVADDWQGRGVGSEILGRLAARTAARGVQVLIMDVLPENQQMLAMISRRWPGAALALRAGSVTARVRLPDAARAAAAACGAAARRAA